MNYKYFDTKKCYDDIDEELYNYIIERDNGLCQICGFPGNNIHHILYRSEGGRHFADNLILLCIKCHDKEHFIKKHPKWTFFEAVRHNTDKLKLNCI
jgi:5-methylcytosine-specific restriction endonuclease McrA